MALNLQAGDVLIRSKNALSDHFGIYLGVGEVAENCTLEGEVQIVSIDHFLQGKNLQSHIPFDGADADRKLVRPYINDLLGKPYDLVRFNCEHFEVVHFNAPEDEVFQSNPSNFGFRLRHLLLRQPQLIRALQGLVAFILLRH